MCVGQTKACSIYTEARKKKREGGRGEERKHTGSAGVGEAGAKPAGVSPHH